MRTRIATPALALALGLTLAACGQGDGNEATPGEGDHLAGSPGGNRTALPSDDATQVSPQPSDDASAAGGGDDATAAALAAITAAEDQAGGTAFAVDDADENDTWEVKVRVGDASQEVEVDADGQVVSTEDGDLDDGDRQALDGAQVTLAEAIESALAEGNGTLDDAELDDEDDTYFWAVTVDEDGDDVDYRVDLASGEVTRD
ncbi:PepSY domain-containing protein [Isoptericola variabilis]|uniref:Propeptide PepSY amd peptidase M4 n=1 Tax=Isoptericola variabilis (strain 225) TaxID=743718 RepID=F6FRP4_ISOV2|nr:PepSY domain-containing protein [Isoptericola variabilis]AEG42985.1 Propeptide PepSY amd peptidase M4 [Isoptericola variabilis 225]TWH30043.1 peptidase YpeB-like protein [Isoptericola variabilis J7]